MANERTEGLFASVIKWHMIIKNDRHAFKPHLWANHGFYTVIYFFK
jgi:hypothetical protein